jgi:hypothetical protein
MVRDNCPSKSYNVRSGHWKLIKLSLEIQTWTRFENHSKRCLFTSTVINDSKSLQVNHEIEAYIHSLTSEKTSSLSKHNPNPSHTSNPHVAHTLTSLFSRARSRYFYPDAFHQYQIVHKIANTSKTKCHPLLFSCISSFSWLFVSTPFRLSHRKYPARHSILSSPQEQRSTTAQVITTRRTTSTKPDTTEPNTIKNTPDHTKPPLLTPPPYPPTLSCPD